MTITKHLFFVLFLTTIISPSILAKIDSKNLPEQDYLTECSTSKEYITTFNFLKKHKEFKLDQNTNKKISLKVSKGCTGASKRFIKITNLLIKAGLDSKNSVETGIKYSKLSRSQTNAFIKIFKMSFLAKYLDLDILNSLKMANRLSGDFEGDSKNTLNDFQKLTKFCVTKQSLDLPKAVCAKFAVEIAHLGKSYKDPMSGPYIKLFHFLSTNKKGPSLTTYKAMTLSKKIMTYGPLAQKNYTQAYRYAVSKKGLKLDTLSSMKFAMKLTSSSVKK